MQDTIQKIKRQVIKWEKIFANHIPEKGLVPRLYKEHLNAMIKGQPGAGEDSWESLGRQGAKQSILKEINPEYSLEGLMLKLQNFGLLMQRDDSLGKDWEMLETGKCWERLR